MRAWRGADIEQLKENSTYAATLPDQRQATAYFDQLTTRLPSAATALQLGKSVVITVPLEAEEPAPWERELRTKDQFVIHDPNWRIQAVAPDEATAEQWLDEWQSYLYLSYPDLIPPWRENDPRSDEERARHQEIRRYLHQALVAIRTMPPDDDFARDMQEIMRRAIQKQDQAEIQNQFREMQEKATARHEAASAAAIQKLRAEATEEELPLLELIERSELLLGKVPDKEARAELRKLAGVSDDGRDGAFGEATRDGLKLELDVTVSRRPDLVIPAILRELEKLGCRELKCAVGF